MDITYPFTPGTRAVAQQVNTNFADVKSAVDPLQTDVATIKTQLTSGIILPDGSVDFTRLQSYKTYVVSNATNATPIVVTAVAHGFLTGDKVYISGVGGNTAANGTFTITKIGVDTFSLDGSVGNGAFSSNGKAVIYPNADDNLVNKAYAADNNLSHLTAVGKSVISNLSMPSSSYIDLTLGASGSTYTAPADGWLWLSKFSSAIGQYAVLIGVLSSENYSTVTTEQMNLYIPARRGDLLTYYYSLSGTTSFFRFVYAEGSKI